MRLKSLSVLLLGLMLSSTAVLAIAGKPGAMVPPDQVVHETASQMFAAIEKHRADIKKDPEELYKLVGNILLPHFDFDYASRLVLGRYWRTATPQQRKEFEDAFYQYLVHQYADGMLKGNYSDRSVKVEPWRGSDSDTRTFVRSKVMLGNNGSPVAVNYAMVKTKDGWKAYDVIIEGISYVMSYRTQFGTQIEQQGIDAVIKKLKADAAKPKPANDKQG